MSVSEYLVWSDSGDYGAIVVWEDDNDACVVKKDPDWVSAAWSAIVEIILVHEAIRGINDTVPHPKYGFVAPVFGFGVAQLMNWFLYQAFSNDDYVGAVWPTAALNTFHPHADYAIVNENNQIDGYMEMNNPISPNFSGTPPAYPPPPLVNVTINGVGIVSAYSQCQWTASPSSGVEPYTFQWQVDDQDVGNGSSTLIHTSGNTTFVISLTVVDDNGLPGWAWKEVTISGGATCLDQ